MNRLKVNRSSATYALRCEPKISRRFMKGSMLESLDKLLTINISCSNEYISEFLEISERMRFSPEKVNRLTYRLLDCLPDV